MAVLNQWQKITRVLPGLPFGNGSAGDLTSATVPSVSVKSCSGTANSTTLTIASGDFTNGDVVLIHQTRGTGVGQWEINRVSSGGGTTSLTMQTALKYTYTDSGASQAQVIEVPMYSSVTASSGTWTIPVWDGNQNGVFAIAVKNTLTITGTINGAGNGFVGGSGSGGSPPSGIQGEGTSGVGAESTSANGNGGGGGSRDIVGTDMGAGGGGGGNGASGTTGQNGGSGSTPGGTGGGSSGSADLTSFTIGGAGGGGGHDNSADGTAGSGGDGGASFVAFAKTITGAGGVNLNGANGTNSNTSWNGGGGGGAGGSALFACQTANFSSMTVSASAGGKGESGGGLGATVGDGGPGAVGRIAVHHSGPITGTTTPTFTDTTDGTLVESSFLGAMI